ncbi:MAG TPA: zf-HC2 domain-containing protein [Burkholderiales bacterium]|nr:zf-HC2 domain-containing protein [Burkholderiales bacterium]
MIGWLKCRDAARLASQAMDRRLTLGESAALRVHLSICEGCTNFRKQVEFLRAAIRQLGTRDP